MGGSRLKDPLPEKDPLAVKDPLLKDGLLKEGRRPAVVLGSLMPMSAEEALVVAMLGYLRYSGVIQQVRYVYSRAVQQVQYTVSVYHRQCVWVTEVVKGCSGSDAGVPAVQHVWCGCSRE